MNISSSAQWMPSQSAVCLPAMLFITFGLMSCKSVVTSNTRSGRAPNVAVQKEALRLSKLGVRSIALEYQPIDFGAKPQKIVTVTKDNEVKLLLEALSRSDHADKGIEATGDAIGEEDQVLMRFYGNKQDKVGQMCILSDEVESRWGEAVRTALNKYMPPDVRRGADRHLRWK